MFAKEPDRPNLDEKGKKSLWIPPALGEVINPEMKTRGKYKYGYPQGAIIHFTAGRDNAKATMAYGRSQGHAYLCIAGSGTIYQAHPLNRWGYHAGKSYVKGLGSGVSQYLVGIEVCCAGKLEKKPNGTFRSWFGETYSDDEVRYSTRRANIQPGWYHQYTTEQEASLVKLIKWLYWQSGGLFKLEYVLGHDEVSPVRKNDPGASLSQTMPEFRSYLSQLIKAD